MINGRGDMDAGRKGNQDLPCDPHDDAARDPPSTAYVF